MFSNCHGELWKYCEFIENKIVKQTNNLKKACGYVLCVHMRLYVLRVYPHTKIPVKLTWLFMTQIFFAVKIVQYCIPGYS